MQQVQEKEKGASRPSTMRGFRGGWGEGSDVQQVHEQEQGACSPSKMNGWRGWLGGSGK